MSDKASYIGWWSVISKRVRERDIQRQVMYNNIRKASTRHNDIANFVAGRVPAIILKFLEMMLGSLLGFWIIGKLLEYTLHLNQLYTFPVFGILYSMQATYYKYRLSVDPNYKTPKCRCAGSRNGNMEKVLQSKESAILGVPNSVWAAVFYSTLLIAMYFRYLAIMTPVAIVAFFGSMYLSYVMVVKIGSLCENCINIIALNILILFQILS
jgi:uncharacterized membrane protein